MMMSIMALVLLRSLVSAHFPDCDCSSAPISPVCGADGLTYQSECEARCEGLWSCAGTCPQACAENPPLGWDYFTCDSLPHYWEHIAEDYSVDDCAIGFNTTEGQWYIDDEPTCVAWGEYNGACNTDYFCAGYDGTKNGYGFEQMEALVGMISGDLEQHRLCPVCPPTTAGFVDVCHDGTLYSFPIDGVSGDFGAPGSIALEGRGTWLTCDCTEVHIGHYLSADTYWYGMAESVGLVGDLVSYYNDVWYYDGKYSCVAMGQNIAACDDSVYHCSGSDGVTYGWGIQQMTALLSSSELQSGAHEDCPLP